jgi:hypothetical protein
MKKIHLKHKKNIEERLSDEVDKEIKEVKREWRHFLKFKDENHLLFMAFVILITATVVINAAYIINRTRDTRRTPLKAKTVVYTDSSKVLTSQQVGANDAETVKISNVTENDKTDRAFTIDSNETMLILNISITNSTNAAQQLIPVNHFYIRTNEGDIATLHASSFVTDPIAAADVAPGKTVSGQLSFNVPKHIAHPLLYVDTGWGKNVPLVYDVLR